MHTGYHLHLPHTPPIGRWCEVLHELLCVDKLTTDANCTTAPWNCCLRKAMGTFINVLG